MLYFYVKLKKYDIRINANILPKCPKIGITVGSLLNRPWDSQQKSRFEFLKYGPKNVAILITFIAWRVRKKQETSSYTRLSSRIVNGKNQWHPEYNVLISDKIDKLRLKNRTN